MLGVQRLSVISMHIPNFASRCLLPCIGPIVIRVELDPEYPIGLIYALTCAPWRLLGMQLASKFTLVSKIETTSFLRWVSFYVTR
jgi:hypothetical protein